jgi:hypothetical protein
LVAEHARDAETGSRSIKRGFCGAQDELRPYRSAYFASGITKYPLLNARNAGERNDGV